MKSIVPSNIRINHTESPQEKERAEIFGKEYKRLSRPAHMAKLINYALYDIMLQYKNGLIFGEDVAKK